MQATVLFVEMLANSSLEIFFSTLFRNNSKDKPLGMGVLTQWQSTCPPCGKSEFDPQHLRNNNKKNPLVLFGKD